MQHKSQRRIRAVIATLAGMTIFAEAGATIFATADPLKAFVRQEYAWGSDYFIHGNEDTFVFQCHLSKPQSAFEGVALSEISIWGNRSGPWEVFRKRPDGLFEYIETRELGDTSCLESCRTREYLASGRCAWMRGWPRSR
jgi:hypothetical protein